MRDVDDNAPTIVNPRSMAEAASAFQAELSRYTLEDKLGAGGMAAVYRARDKVSGRMVALKLIENGDDDQARQARFEREVRAAGRLEHPNICRVLSFGRAPSQLFMTMELVEGVTLHKMIKARGTLPVPVALECLRQLLAALACAHQAGVVHRDLKPANVMITPDGTLKLLDFGIAKSQEDATVTATGLLVGTPAFMAPEQILGNRTDPKSDLFSAGITFLVMLTGRTRYHGMEPATVMVKVSSEPVPSLLEECPAAAVSVDRFFQKLCAQSPADRFQSAHEAMQALIELEDLPLDAPPGSPGAPPSGEGPAILARYLADPDAVALAVAQACAAKETARAERLMRKGGAAAHPAAALSLYRAQLLLPIDSTRRALAELCAAAALTFDPVDDPRIAEAMAAFENTPSAPGVLKRLADLYKARGHVLLAAAFLSRYLRVKPNDSHAANQLQVLLDGPESAQEKGPGTGDRLRTRDIIAGIKTGGHIAGRSGPSLARVGPPSSQEQQPPPSPLEQQQTLLRQTAQRIPLARSAAAAAPPPTSGARSPAPSTAQRQAGAQQQPARAVKSNGLPDVGTGMAPMPTVVVAGGGGGDRPILNVHPLVLVVAAVVVAGLVLAFFGRFIRTSVDGAQLAISDNVSAETERSSLERKRKQYLDEAQGEFARGNWAAAAHDVNMLIATNPPAEQALAGMWLRAQCRLKLGDEQAARAELEEYVKQATLTDAHRDEAKRLLDDLYARRAAQIDAAAKLDDRGALHDVPPAPSTPGGGGLY